MTYAYTFTQHDANRASQEWGCNCGPAALAFACQLTLDQVRPALPAFDERKYTNPSMMKAALDILRRSITEVKKPAMNRSQSVSVANMYEGSMSLIRIQWTGPWTDNQFASKWASKYTHWVATWLEAGMPMVFDINSGIVRFAEWSTVTVPKITETIQRSDGGWYAANVWRLQPAGSAEAKGIQ